MKRDKTYFLDKLTTLQELIDSSNLDKHDTDVGNMVISDLQKLANQVTFPDETPLVFQFIELEIESADKLFKKHLKFKIPISSELQTDLHKWLAKNPNYHCKTTFLL